MFNEQHKKNLQSLECLEWVEVLQDLVVGQAVSVGLHPAEQKSRLEVIKFMSSKSWDFTVSSGEGN